MTATDFDQSLLDLTAKESQLTEAKEKIAGPIPLIPSPTSCMLTLPRGLLRGVDWQQDAEVKELTGADEEALSRVRDAVAYFDLVLAHGVVRIGTVDMATHPVSERLIILQELLVGERQQLLLAVIKVTYGDTKTLNVTCPNPDCKAEQEVDLILSEDFKAKAMDDPHKLTYSFTTSKQEELQYRLVTGADQMAALDKKGASIAEQNSLILSRVIVSVGGGLLVNPLEFARGMSMRDRNALLEKLTTQQPDVDLTLKTSCAGCGGEQVLALTWPDLFRP